MRHPFETVAALYQETCLVGNQTVPGSVVSTMISRLGLCIAIGTWTVAIAQIPEPTFTAETVQPANAANKPYPLMPGRNVTIYGHDLGPISPCIAETPTKTTSLCGVEVMVGADAAELLYVSAPQINFRVPQTTPTEGTAELRVVNRGQSSQPVTMKLGAGRPEIELDGPAYTNMPVWIRVSMPLGIGEFSYPVGIDPAATDCHEIEVRRSGALLPRLPKQAPMGMVHSGPACGFLSLRAERKHSGRLPLHLLYRFDQPGTYEVRLTRTDGLTRPRTLAVSDWTPIEILAAPPGRRAEWLAEISRQPESDTVALLEDVLPSVLGVPDEASLVLLTPYLFHPDTLVRRYTALGLGYWPEAERKAVAVRLLRERGPTDVTADLLRDQSEMAVQEALPYLQSESPVLVTGAVTLIRNLRSQVTAALRSQAEAALIQAADHIRDFADEQTQYDYASVLGQIRTGPAHEALWRWVDSDIAVPAAAGAITGYADRLDLPRLARLFDVPVANEKARDLVMLPNALRHAYGDDALPYLEGMLNTAASVFVRTYSARELVLAGRPSGFAFIADAIENNRSYKAEMIRLIRDQIVNMRSASEEEVLTFTKQRATVR